MSIPVHVLDDFRRHALVEYPRESCGLAVVIHGRMRYWPCRNLATNPTEHFILDGKDWANAEEAGGIVALLHSHPDHPATPSPADRAVCEELGVASYIVSVERGDDGTPRCAAIHNIVPEGYRAPLIGRPFYHGVLDCYSLCRDWYRDEWGLTLPNFQRQDAWWDDGASNLYLEHFKEAGFEVVTNLHEEFTSKLQVGDGILMQIRSKNLVPNHAAVYLGEGKMIHHLYGRLSTTDVYGGYWLECTRYILRHRSRM